MTRLDDYTPTLTQQSKYRYERFTPSLLLQDLRFSRHALKPGDAFPTKELSDTDGGVSYLGGDRQRPLLLVTGSITCPMTESSMPVIDGLYREFGDQIDFTLLATREAHPGENFPQPHDQEVKISRARALEEHHDVPYTVAVDDIEGTVHQLFDGKPNTAYLLDSTGIVIFRSHWARDERSLRKAMLSVINGVAPASQKSAAMLGPVARAMGSVDHVMHKAGPQAKRDLWLSGLPMAMTGKVARLFGFLEPDHRGIAAVATISLGTIAIAAAIIAALV
jgi:hypothetical protein